MKKSGFVVLIILSVVLVVMIAVLSARIITKVKRGENGTAGETVAGESAAGSPEEGAAESAAGSPEEDAGESAAAESPEEGAITEENVTPEDAAPAAEEAAPQAENEPAGVSLSEGEGLEGAALSEGEDEDFERFLSDSIEGFSFDKYSNEIWSGPISLLDGSSDEKVLPVMKDPDSGEKILADGYRKIVCVEESGSDLVPIVLNPDAPDDEAMMNYYCFIQVADLFASAGWLRDEEEGELNEDVKAALGSLAIPADRLVYIGESGGCHLFKFGASNGGDYYELYKTISKLFGEEEGMEYALILK
ncbi:MAG: hypothetical protein IJ857_08640 [Lachnospiraceae bacterium]|nr:hypothetical protein [Lachnospiraceae bacterium]